MTSNNYLRKPCFHQSPPRKTKTKIVGPSSTDLLEQLLVRLLKLESYAYSVRHFNHIAKNKCEAPSPQATLPHVW